MRKVNTAPAQSVRVDLEPPEEGVSPENQPHILFRPLITPGKAAGRGAVRDTVMAGEPLDVAGVAFTITVARWGLLSWVGVADQDDQPLECTKDNLQLLMEQEEDVYELVDRHYVRPALGLDAEKNGSAPSRDGTSPDSSQTKTAPAGAGRGAAGTTAATSVRGQRKAPARARPAPTKSASRKRK